ncbi:NAD(P)H-dependent oxidoreductase [Bacillus shivajii]|uniref:NADPH-dependent FMN reductase n=1 Tax=Bacillus shivajii TaxID=1983719 RepID=UPI001CFB0260|nr:NAD(P)H-dependent oxidoreductase [Bacillus shivajii]UCZ55154.1 NAD(P)H-dependent oxidoreductase [Bacillus shivajii]
MKNMLIISGSPRKSSISSKVGQWLSNKYHLNHFDLSEYLLPLFDDSVHTADNPIVNQFKEKVSKADAYIVITPEYHGGMSGSLKNSLDFLNKSFFKDKPTFLISVAGGGKGGINALNQLRMIMRALQADIESRQLVIDAPIWNEEACINELSSLIDTFVKKNSLDKSGYSEDVMGL